MKIAARLGFRIKLDGDDHWNYLSKSMMSSPMFNLLHKGMDVEVLSKDDYGFIVNMRIIKNVSSSPNAVKLCICGHRKGIHVNSSSGRVACCLSSCKCIRFMLVHR